MKHISFSKLLMIATLALLGACRAPEAEPGAVTGTDSELPAGVSDLTNEASAEDDIVILWEGKPPGEGLAGETCGRLEIHADARVSFGPCGGSLTITEFSGTQWKEILSRFASFDLEGKDDRLRFRGQGKVDGPAWRSGLAAWARGTYGELASGHVCAACRTILTWPFGLLKEVGQECAVLWATDFGYASLESGPCDGGESKVTGQGWLETDEWAELEGWLRNRAPLPVDDSGGFSFLGEGTQPMSQDEQAALAAWAESVAKRLNPGLDLADHSETTEAAGLCPEVPRPAVSLFLPGEGYLIIDPVSGQKCYTTLDGDIPGLFQTVIGAVFYTVLQEDQFVVKRLGRDGSASLLSFTAVDRDDALLYHSYVVSPDGSRIAWSATSAGADYAGPEVSTMRMAGMDGAGLATLLSEERSGDGERWAPVPVRFSEDNSTLFYTLQPIGMGGMWSSYIGRYDNLYALHLGTEAEPALIFDCADEQYRLCIGDFIEFGGQVTTLAYVKGNSVVILDGEDAVVNTIVVKDDYVGYPIFGPTGDLVFYGADLDEGPNASIMPLMGTIYHLASPTAPREVLANDPRLFLPRDWLDPAHIVVGYIGDNEEWGVAVVDRQGSLQPVDAVPDSSYVNVLSH